MPTPKFVLGLNELEFPDGVHYPGERPFQKIQTTDRTAGGGLQVEDLGVDIRRIRLVFKYMTLATYQGLETWFDTIANGAANSFEYHDETGTVHTVQLLTNPLNFRQFAHQQFEGELLLEVVA